MIFDGEIMGVLGLTMEILTWVCGSEVKGPCLKERGMIDQCGATEVEGVELMFQIRIGFRVAGFLFQGIFETMRSEA